MQAHSKGIPREASRKKRDKTNPARLCQAPATLNQAASCVFFPPRGLCYQRGADQQTWDVTCVANCQGQTNLTELKMHTSSVSIYVLLFKFSAHQAKYNNMSKNQIIFCFDLDPGSVVVLVWKTSLQKSFGFGAAWEGNEYTNKCLDLLLRYLKICLKNLPAPVSAEERTLGMIYRAGIAMALPRRGLPFGEEMWLF